MEVKAQLKQLRIAPRKVRLVANLIKGMNVENARYQLEYSTKKSSKNILTLLNSAVANAKNNHKLVENNLYISKIIVNGGAVLKRSMPRAMGRAFPIKKRMSHVMLVLKTVGSNIAEEDSGETAKEAAAENKKEDVKNIESSKEAELSVENEANKTSQEQKQEKENVGESSDNLNNNSAEIKK